MAKNSENAENYFFTTKIWSCARIIDFCFQTIQYIKQDLLKSRIEFNDFILDIDFNYSSKIEMFIKGIVNVHKKLKSKLMELNKKEKNNTQEYKDLYSDITKLKE